MALTKKVTWWDWLPVFGWRIVGACEAADEVPDKLPRRGAFVVVSGGVRKWLVFDCACGTGHRIMLQMQGAPSWKVSEDRPLTLTPSIDFRGSDRRCHYYVRSGKVEWV